MRLHLVTFYLYLSIILVGCFSQSHTDNHLKGRHIAAVLRANSEHGSGAPPYADVYVYDIDSAQLIRITDDSYYDDHPQLSPDLAHVAFLANREGSATGRAIKGVGGPYEMYIADIPSSDNDNTSAPFPTRLATSKRADFSALQWRQDSRSILFSTCSNVVYQLDTHTDSIQSIFTLPSGDRIFELELAPNDSLLTVGFCTPDVNQECRDRVGVLNLSSLSWRVIRESKTNIGSWSPAGNRFAYRDSLFYIYDYKTNRSTQLSIPDSIRDNLGGAPRFYDSRSLLSYWSPRPIDWTKSSLILLDINDMTIRRFDDPRVADFGITQVVERK